MKTITEGIRACSFWVDTDTDSRVKKNVNISAESLVNMEYKPKYHHINVAIQHL